MQSRDKFFNTLACVRAACGSTSSDEVAVLTWAGHLDAARAKVLRRALIEGAQGGSWRYVFDLTRIKSIDSSGLATLITVLRAITDLGGSVGLVTASSRFQRLLELCARSRRCKIYRRTSDAMSAMSPLRPKSAA